MSDMETKRSRGVHAAKWLLSYDRADANVCCESVVVEVEVDAGRVRRLWLYWPARDALPRAGDDLED